MTDRLHISAADRERIRIGLLKARALRQIRRNRVMAAELAAERQRLEAQFGAGEARQ